MCIRAKHCSNTHFRHPLEQIYDPCDGPEDVMEIDFLGELPASDGYTHTLTACDVFSRYVFAVPIRQLSTSKVAHALLQIFVQDAFLPKIQWLTEDLLLLLKYWKKSWMNLGSTQSRYTQTCLNHWDVRTKPSKAQTNPKGCRSCRQTPFGTGISTLPSWPTTRHTTNY